jgi:hypothetical protein
MKVKATQDFHVPRQLSATKGQILELSDELAETLSARGLVEEIKAIKMVEDVKLEPVTLTEKNTTKKSNK